MTNTSTRKKGRRYWRPKSWEERREADRLPVQIQHDRQLFQPFFIQTGKWLRDRFFGTEAAKSGHGFESRPQVGAGGILET